MSDNALCDRTLILAVDLVGVTFLWHEWGGPWPLMSQGVALCTFMSPARQENTFSYYETASTYATTCMYSANLPRNLVRVPGLSTIIICVSSSTVFAFRGIPRLLAGREEKRKQFKDSVEILYIRICFHKSRSCCLYDVLRPELLTWQVH